MLLLTTYPGTITCLQPSLPIIEPSTEHKPHIIQTHVWLREATACTLVVWRELEYSTNCCWLHPGTIAKPCGCLRGVVFNNEGLRPKDFVQRKGHEWWGDGAGLFSGCLSPRTWPFLVAKNKSDVLHRIQKEHPKQLCSSTHSGGERVAFPNVTWKVQFILLHSNATFRRVDVPPLSTRVTLPGIRTVNKA